MTAPGAASPPPNDPVTAPATEPLPGKGGFLAAYREQMAAQPPGTAPADPAAVNKAFNLALNEAARHPSGSPGRLIPAWVAESLLRGGTFDGARRRLHRDVRDAGTRDSALARLDELERLVTTTAGRQGDLFAEGMAG